jgi:hypothetical protein
MSIQSLPSVVRQVIDQYRVCEFTTLTRDGTPVTWPVATELRADGRFLVTASLGLPYKAINARRNPHVSLLFSDPTASGMTNAPVVLVQGDAEVPERIVTSHMELREYWRDHIMSRQPAGKMYSMNALTRRFFDWYYMRLLVFVTPCRILWWPDGDQSQPAQLVEASHVG